MDAFGEGEALKLQSAQAALARKTPITVQMIKEIVRVMRLPLFEKIFCNFLTPKILAEQAKFDCSTVFLSGRPVQKIR